MIYPPSKLDYYIIGEKRFVKEEFQIFIVLIVSS